jgi:hypothetical protein
LTIERKTLPMLIVVAIAAVLASASVGGGLYEFTVVDPFWPKRPDLVQPARGGISRKRFWIAIHVAFELVLIAALVWSWSQPAVRTCLLVALASHAIMRLWSAFDFIPKALAFEKAEPGTVSEATARAWTTRSRWRLPLDLITSGAMLWALVLAARLG